MVKITTDSTADLEYLYEQRGIDVIPLLVTLGGKEYYDCESIQPQDIFEFYDENRELPKTSARSVEEYKEFFSERMKDGSEIIHFTISEQISVSYANACAAANELGHVYVVNSMSLSTGIGLLILKACDLRDEGLDAKTIYDRILEIVPRVQASFIIDNLEYLYKGGRCTGVARFFSTALSIKPMIMLKDGQMVVGQKYMGKFSKNVLKYVEAILKKYDSPDYTRIFITHSYAKEKDVEAVKEYLQQNVPQFKEIIITHAGCTITSHCGKGTLGILYIN